MQPDVVAYQAIHRARSANAVAVHLDARHLTAETLAMIRSHGIEVYSPPINEEPLLVKAVELGITKICTDDVAWMLGVRQQFEDNSPAWRSDRQPVV